ncbi:hypothetical protein MPAR168_05035 [Methylorubrum populi]|uniref:Iron ABC transporter permease n=1 Tax=Methylobacterium radiotolerans TaxID=31998 RepID=A0ABU7TAC2_9HYPH
MAQARPEGGRSDRVAAISGSGTRIGPRGLQRAWPWLALTVGLGLATMPAWRVLAFGVRTSVEDLLQIRCLPW